MVGLICDKHVVAFVQGYAEKVVERSTGADAVGKRGQPAPSERGHHTAPCDSADAVISEVRDKNVSTAVHSHAAGIFETRAR
jgi:hypothetical protein